ncbi:TIGR04372 family glycosyltransferase [Pelagibacteraceae bacterium]|nr:TIGR04372 family glycosyltransferase [Pelagibacteraceae bacterium]
MKRSIKRLFYYILYFASFPFALIFLLAVILIRKKVVVKWACLRSSRIGHMSIDPTIYYLYRKKNLLLDELNSINIFYNRFDIANITLAKMWNKKLLFFPSTFMHAVDKIYGKVELILPSNNLHTIGMYNYKSGDSPKPPWLNRDIYNQINRNDNVLEFTEVQKRMGREFLNKIGVNNNNFVCLYVRDENYLKQMMPKNDWSHHQFRNSNIDDFHECASYLTKQGIHVFRIGSVVNKPMDTKGNKMIIDYSTNGMRNDFLDIYLLANCKFCISTSGGLDNVSLIFNKPVLLIGVLPIIDLQSYYKKVLVSTRQIYSKNLGRTLSLKELYTSGLGEAYEQKIYDKNKVNILEPSSKDILNLTKRMVNLIESNFKLSKEEKKLQESFKKAYLEYFYKNKSGQIYHRNFSAIFDPNFLINNQKWWLN